MWKIYAKIKEAEGGHWYSPLFGKSSTSMSGHMKPIVLAHKSGDADAVAVGAEN